MSGNTGSIVINISDSIGGGDPVTYNFDVVVSLENSNYNFTGGTPAASSTFGNNGARWNGQTYTTGASPTQVTYNWSRTVNAGTDYVVILFGADGALHTHWGHIWGLTQQQAMMSSPWADGEPELEFDIPRGTLPRPKLRSKKKAAKKGSSRPGMPR